MFGRKEGLALFFSLTGKNADQYKKKLEALTKANGSLDDAFKKQTEGINKAGFTWDKFKAAIQVFAQRIGQLLLPILQILIKFISKIVEWFQALPEPIKKVILVFAAVAAAIGPVLAIVGAFIKVFAILKVVVIAFQVAAAPLLIKFALIAAAIVGIILLVKYLVKNWKKVKKVVMKALKPWLKILKPIWQGLKEGFKSAGKVIIHIFKQVLKVIGPVLKATFKLVGLIGKVANFISGPGVSKGLYDFAKKQEQKEKTRMFGRRVAPPPGRSDITLRIQTDKGTSARVERMKKSGNTRVNVFTPGFRGVSK